MPGTYGPWDPGGGEWLPHLEIRAWFNDPALAPARRHERDQAAGRVPQIQASWSQILGHWAAIELDLDDRGHDVESGILDRRSWRWLSLRILGLISTPSTRLYRCLTATETEGTHAITGPA